MKNRSFFSNLFSSNRFVPVWIALTVAVIYSNTLGSPFVFDDMSRIADNVEIRELSRFFSLGRLLEPRAFVELTFALNYSFQGLNVFGYHLINMLIHVLNGLMVYLLVKVVLKQRPDFIYVGTPSFQGRTDSSIHACHAAAHNKCTLYHRNLFFIERV